MSRYNKYSQIK
jgi:hypothetical protein